MRMKEIECFLKKALQDSEKYIEIGFVRKSAGIINIPYMDSEIKDEILKRLSHFVLSEVTEGETAGRCKKTALLDGAVSVSAATGLSAVRLNDNRSFDWKKIDYYIIKIEIRSRTMKLYGVVSKLRVGKNSIYLHVNRNRLEKMDADYIGIGEKVDILEWRDEILVFKEEALENVFGKSFL